MKYIYAFASAVVFILLSGCASADIRPESVSQHDQELISGLVSGTRPDTLSAGSGGEETEPAEPEEDVTVSVTSSTPQHSVEIPPVEVATTPDADSDFNIFYSEVHDQFVLSEEEMSFVEHTLFVGDSICSGFSEYGIISPDRVAAKGNLGSRSFFDYSFKFRGRVDLTYEQVLKLSRPRYVILSMGMNDVNMVNEETYCENYRKVIEATLSGSKAEVFVAAITPVCSKFCANSVIDSFNDTMREFIADEFPERVHYFDFGQYLKNEQGKLRTCLHSGDGVHLGPYCYYIALWEIHRALMEAGLWDGTAPIGTFEEEQEEVIEPADLETTSSSEEVSEDPPPVPSKTTARSKITKPAPSKTTKAIPVDTAEPAEPQRSTEQPQEISEETDSTAEIVIATIEAPPAE